MICPTCNIACNQICPSCYESVFSEWHITEYAKTITEDDRIKYNKRYLEKNKPKKNENRCSRFSWF